MQEKTKKYLFEFFYYAFLILIVATFFIYNKEFFLKLTAGGVFQVRDKIIFYVSHIFLIFLALFLIFFKKYIWKKRNEFLLLLATLVITFFILEMSVRIMGKGKLYATETLYSPHPYLDYYGTPGYKSDDGLNIHNSLGFRGPEIITPKPKGVYRIILIGGSTVYDTGVNSWKDDTARQLQAKLRERYNTTNIEIINAGLAGWTTWEDLINLEFKVLDLQPDLIIIYEGINDVSARLVNPDVYKSDDTGFRKQWGFPKVPLIFHSALLRYLANYQITLFDVVNAPTANTGMQYLGFTDKLNNTAEGVLNMNMPIYFERNIKNMIAISKDNGVYVLLSTFALSAIDTQSKLPYNQKGIAQQNEVIKNIGIQKNILVFDFSSVMPKDSKYWVDGIHLNKEGINKKAELFAEYIQTHKLINFQFTK